MKIYGVENTTNVNSVERELGGLEKVRVEREEVMVGFSLIIMHAGKEIIVHLKGKKG